MKKIILIFLMLSSLIIATGCEDHSLDDNAIIPPVLEATPDTILFIEEPPYRVKATNDQIDIAERTILHVFIHPANQQEDTLYSKRYVLYPGCHSFPELFFFPLYQFAYGLETLYTYSILQIEQNEDGEEERTVFLRHTVMISTNGNPQFSAKNFYEEHYNLNEYLRLEYTNARDHPGDNLYQDTMYEWLSLNNREKLHFLSSPFNRHPFPILNEEGCSGFAYWLVLKHPKQYGFGWPDQTGDNPETPEWDGTSDLYNAYKALFE